MRRARSYLASLVAAVTLLTLGPAFSAAAAVFAYDGEDIPGAPDASAKADAGPDLGVPDAGVAEDDFLHGYDDSSVLARALSRLLGDRLAPQMADDVAGSIRHVNPTGSIQNCVACAIATDARLAGNPASALAVPPQPISVLSRHFGAAWKNVAGPDEILDMMNAAGPGARGIVYGAPPVGSSVGHVFNAVNQRGVVRFLDGQIGGPASFEGYTGFKFLWTHQP